MSLSDVSGVLIHHDNYPAVLSTVQSLFDAGLLAERLIVVDNSPTPEAFEALRRDLSESTVIRVPNRGYAAAMLEGLDELAATGKMSSFTLVSTHEVLVANDALTQLRSALLADPVADVAGPTLMDRHTGKVWSAGGTLDGLGVPRHVAASATLSTIVEKLPQRRTWLDGALCLYRTEALLNDPPRTEFFLYFEETELHTRLTRRNRHVLWVPGAVASQTSAGVPPSLLTRNLHIFVGLHGTPIARIAAVPMTIARRAVRALLGRAMWSDVRDMVSGWGDGRRTLRTMLKRS